MKNPDWKTTPPDFSGWPKTKRDSIFYFRGADDFRRKPFEEKHSGIANWLGHIGIYEDDKGVMAGQEFIFFGERSILKFWGLKGEDYAFFSLLKNGKWRSFSRKLYQPGIQAIATDIDPHLMIGARVLIKDLQRNKAVVLEQTVWRGEVSAPPA